MHVYLIVALILIIVMIVIGTPVAFALGTAASLMIFMFMNGGQIQQLGSIAFSQGTSSNQLVAPLFILMAEFLSIGGIASDIFTALNNKMKNLKGGLAISAVVASTIFAAMCGSSSATAAAIGRVSIREMIAKGYREDFAAGTVMAGGTLGIMIPPSITFVTYGIITETSISKLLMAGLLPGLMIAGMLCVFVYIRVRLNPDLVNAVYEKAEEDDQKVEEFKNKKKRSFSDSMVLKIVAPAILIVAVLGCMYTGAATPTESAGIGAIGALIIVILLRRCNKNMMMESFSQAAKTSAMILFLVICGFGLTYVVAYLNIASSIAAAIAASGVNKWVVIILVYCLWLLLGCLMDPGSMVVLTIPFLLPALNALGFDTIWLGVVSTLMVEVGMITPPVGLNLFVTKTISGLEFKTLIKGSLPFLGVFAVALILLTIFPQIALVIPNHM